MNKVITIWCISIAKIFNIYRKSIFNSCQKAYQRNLTTILNNPP